MVYGEITCISLSKVRYFALQPVISPLRYEKKDLIHQEQQNRYAK